MKCSFFGLINIQVLLCTLSLNFLNYPAPAFWFNMNTVFFSQRTVIEPVDQTASLMMLSPPLLTQA